MKSPIEIELDCIIFGLQSFGGISNYWSRLLHFVATDTDLSASLLLPKQIKYREYNHAIAQRLPASHERFDAKISRYLRAPISHPKGVFHTSYYRLPCVATAKYVVSVYDFTYERYRSGLARHVHSRQKFASILRADTVLCISESTRRDVMQYCPKVDSARLKTIPLGVDRSVFYREYSAGHRDYENVVLFVGQRGGYKRFDLAIEALRAMPELSLGVVGPNLSTHEREQLKERLGNRWVEFGPVPTEELRRLYSDAYAFIFPSDYEGFGLPILEAMACGCPVVAANLSSLPEVGGKQAIYAKEQSGEAYASALQQIASTGSRTAAVQGGIRRAAEFDWEHTMEKTKLAYLG